MPPEDDRDALHYLAALGTAACMSGLVVSVITLIATCFDESALPNVRGNIFWHAAR